MANIFEFLSKDENITPEKACKSRQMQFHFKTAYVWGLRYRWTRFVGSRTLCHPGSTTHLALDPTPASIYITLSEQALYVNNTDIEKICQSWSRPNVEGQRLHCQLPVACSTLPGLPGLPGGPWCPMMLATLDGESSDRSPSRVYCCHPQHYSYNQAICGGFPLLTLVKPES